MPPASRTRVPTAWIRCGARADIVEWGAASDGASFYGYIRTAERLELGEATNLRIGFLVDADGEQATGVEGGPIFSALWLELLKPWGFRTYDEYWELGVEDGPEGVVEYRDYTYGGRGEADTPEDGAWAIGPDGRTLEMRLSYATLNADLGVPAPFGPETRYFVCPFINRRLGPNRREVDVGDTFAIVHSSAGAPTVAVAAGEPRLTVLPEVFSPNGDGCNDRASITLVDVPYPAGAAIEVRAADGAGVVWRGSLGDAAWEWDGFDIHGRPVPDGSYTVSMRSGDVEVSAPVTVRRSTRFAPIRPFSPRTFPVLMWVALVQGLRTEPTEESRAYIRATLSDLKHLNVDVAFYIWAARPMHALLIEEARAAGMQVVLHLVDVTQAISSEHRLTEEEALALAREALEPYLDEPAVYGYYMIDEPWPQRRYNLRLISRALATADPSRPAFACLNGTGRDAAAYFTAVPMAALYHDNYPIQQGRPHDPFPQFSKDMAAIYEGARRFGAPAWLAPQTFGSPSENIPWPTAAEYEAMIYTALGQGIRGIFHFVHHGIAVEERTDTGEVRFRPHELYPTVARIDAELHQLGPVLLRSRPDRDTKLSALPQTVYTFPLRDEGQGRYVIVVNTDVERAVTGLVTAPGLSPGAKWRDLLDGSTLAVDETEAGAAVPIPLKAGQGRMLEVVTGP